MGYTCGFSIRRVSPWKCETVALTSPKCQIHQCSVGAVATVTHYNAELCLHALFRALTIHFLWRHDAVQRVFKGVESYIGKEILYTHADACSSIPYTINHHLRIGIGGGTVICREDGAV